MGASWQLWLTSGVIAAVVAGLVNLPKILGEGRKANADADTVRESTAVSSLKEALAVSNQTCQDCTTELRCLRGVTENLIDAVELLLETNGVAERQQARLRIREARQAL